MRYVCDAPETGAWFRIETQGEAALESQAMSHAIEKHFTQAQERAATSYAPPPGAFIERDIGLKAHIQRVMPIANTDAYPDYADAIKALGEHFGLVLDRSRCYPYGVGEARDGARASRYRSPR